jgi:hypothetical protein
LIALEDRPRTQQELVANLRLPVDALKHALKKLRAARLVEVVDQTLDLREPREPGLRHAADGWSTIRDAIAVVAASVTH